MPEIAGFEKMDALPVSPDAGVDTKTEDPAAKKVMSALKDKLQGLKLGQ